MKKFFSIVMALILSLGVLPSADAKVLNIILEDNPILRNKSIDVENFDSDLSTLLDDMKETMIHAKGCGLAAVQVGSNTRVFIVDTGKGIREYINPKIKKVEGEQTGMEGCLSIPGYAGLVKRPKTVIGTAYDRQGKPFDFNESGFMAQVISHEYDHLDGVLYTDKSLTKISNKKATAISLVIVAAGISIIVAAVAAVKLLFSLVC